MNKSNNQNHPNKKSNRRPTKQKRPMTTYHIQRNFTHVINPNQAGEDGVHHINLATYGRTELGRSLAERRELSLFHPIYGSFATLERFKTWLSLEGHSDWVRDMDTESYKEIINSPLAVQNENVPNYYALLMSAVWYKIKNHPWLFEDVLLNELPYHCYSEHQKTDYRTQRDEGIYLIVAMDVITKAIKEDREPDFTPFMTHPEIPLEESVFGKMGSSRNKIKSEDLTKPDEVQESEENNPATKSPSNELEEEYVE